MAKTRKPESRSLWNLLQMGAPRNIRIAAIWLLYTFLGVGLSFLVGVLINLFTSGHPNSPSLIRHGELFAVSASLLVGSMRLVSKDDGFEAFAARQVVTALAFGAALVSEVGYILLRLVDSRAMQDRIAHKVAGASIYVAIGVIVLVFFITMIDASRIPLEETMQSIEYDYEILSAQMGKPE